MHTAPSCQLALGLSIPVALSLSSQIFRFQDRDHVRVTSHALSKELTCSTSGAGSQKWSWHASS